MQRKRKLLYSILCFLLLVSAGCAKEEDNATEEDHATKTVEIPKFPWPPPRASAMAEIPRHFFRNQSGDVLRLSDVDDILQDALESCGYFERNYYYVPSGFAMVTRLEQINYDGTSKEPPDRWAVEVQPPEKFTLKAYLEALFKANPGYFRIIVFIVTPTLFSQTGKIVSREEAIGWLNSGVIALPDLFSELEFSEEYTCTALMYEFEQPNPGEPTKLNAPSHLQGRTHLTKANLWQALEN